MKHHEKIKSLSHQNEFLALILNLSFFIALIAYAVNPPDAPTLLLTVQTRIMQSV